MQVHHTASGGSSMVKHLVHLSALDRHHVLPPVDESAPDSLSDHRRQHQDHFGKLQPMSDRGETNSRNSKIKEEGSDVTSAGIAKVDKERRR